MNKEVANSNATKLLQLFTSEAVEKKITKEVNAIYPVRNVRVRKIKVLQRPKLDNTKLAEIHENDKRVLGKSDSKKPRGDKKKQDDKPQD